MPAIPITAGACVVCALGLVMLSIPVTARRFAARVPLGYGRDKVLEARARAQANFVEYVPMTLLTLGAAEANGAPSWAIWACAIGLLLGRALHAAGMYAGPSLLRLRQGGMLLTWSTLVAAALALALTLTLQR
jgi:uncharacterized membrane protein YecN with MAPEG domain